MNGEYRIDEQTYKAMDHASQNWMLFQTFNSYRDECDGRFRKLENRKRIDTALSSGSGLLGGFLAIIASKLWFK